MNDCCTMKIGIKQQKHNLWDPGTPYLKVIYSLTLKNYTLCLLNYVPVHSFKF